VEDVTMPESQQDEALDVLACDFRARPKGAPTVFDVLPVVWQVDRGADALTVAFAPGAADMVTAYVEAERLCCTDVRWELDREPGRLRLRIGAKPGQLDILEQMYTNTDLASAS
jgi:hypothetical protein